MEEWTGLCSLRLVSTTRGASAQSSALRTSTSSVIRSKANGALLRHRQQHLRQRTHAHQVADAEQKQLQQRVERVDGSTVVERGVSWSIVGARRRPRCSRCSRRCERVWVRPRRVASGWPRWRRAEMLYAVTCAAARAKVGFSRGEEAPRRPVRRQTRAHVRARWCRPARSERLLESGWPAVPRRG